MKPGSKGKHIGNYVRYIATREGVELAEDTLKNLPATVKQKQLIRQILKDFPDSSDLHEYTNYKKDATRGNASAFISQVMEVHAGELGRRDIYLRYIAERPGVEKLGKHGLFTDEGVPVVLEQVAKEIFRQDQISIYQKQTQYRDQLRSQGRESVAEIVKQINSTGLHNERIEALLVQLSDKLSRTSGKKVYGYLKPEVKAIVNEIVAELAGDERIKKLYDLWYEQREDVLRTYTDHFPERIPLEQNPEFKSIRNAVIQEAMNLLDTKRYYESIYGIHTNLWDTGRKKKAPPGKSGEQDEPKRRNFQSADQQVVTQNTTVEIPTRPVSLHEICMDNALTPQASLRLLQNLSRLIEQKYQQEQRENRPVMDRKQRQELAEKRQALGLRG